MNRHLAIKTSCFCVAYMDGGEGRKQGRGSFAKLRKAIAPAHAPYLRPVGNSRAITRVSRLAYKDVGT